MISCLLILAENSEVTSKSLITQLPTDLRGKLSGFSFLTFIPLAHSHFVSISMYSNSYFTDRYQMMKKILIQTLTPHLYLSGVMKHGCSAASGGPRCCGALRGRSCRGASIGKQVHTQFVIGTLPCRRLQAPGPRAAHGHRRFLLCVAGCPAV